MNWLFIEIANNHWLNVNLVVAVKREAYWMDDEQRKLGWKVLIYCVGCDSPHVVDHGHSEWAAVDMVQRIIRTKQEEGGSE